MKKIKIFLILSIASVTLLSQAQAVEMSLVKRQLGENYNSLIESQVQCAGSYETGNYICNKATAGERRILGTWDSFIVPVAVKNSLPVRYVDSNLFVTAHTLLPLLSIQFSDPVLEKKRQQTADLAIRAVNQFQRNDAFAFWPQIGPSIRGNVNRIGPLNLSPLLLGTQLDIVKTIQNFFHIPLFPSKVRWMEAHVDLKNPDIGIDALFSVPNDADDTALGIAANYEHHLDSPNPKSIASFLQMTQLFGKYADNYETRKQRRYKSYLPECEKWMKEQKTSADQAALYQDQKFLETCSLDDPRESWRYQPYANKHSGAAMTWFFDEKEPIYATPEKGVALPGQNSVDCNVVSNVLYTLALTKKQNDPALREVYQNSCRAISNVILDESGNLRMTKSPRKVDQYQVMPAWRICGLFYPAHMTFPYLISRAVQEANACQDLPAADQQKFDHAMKELARNVIAEQDQVTPLKKSGQWIEDIDSTIALPTTLGGLTLLNFRNAYVDKWKINERDWKTRIDTAVGWVLSLSKRSRSSKTGLALSSIPEGTFFGGGTVDEVAHWRSEPFATAMSLELMSKYVLAYELNEKKRTRLVLSETSSEALSNGTYKATALIPKSLPDQSKISDDWAQVPRPQDSLPPLEVKPWAGEIRAGVRQNFDGSGREAIIGVELSYGQHYSGSNQEQNERIAYYKVKLSGEMAANTQTGKVDDYNINVKFMGISTRTDFILRNEIAFLPIQYIKENSIQTSSIYLTYGELDAPIIHFGGGTYLNLNLTGKLIGAIHKANKESMLPQQRTSLNLAEFNLGFSVARGNWSAAASANVEVGVSRYNDGSAVRSSHRNYRLQGSIKYKFNDRHSVELVRRKVVDGANDVFGKADDQTMLQYQYTWAR